MKTRDRILAASLGLFNERGERSVTTNHIAAHLGMSPGNLYYHFKNKGEIIRELFQHQLESIQHIQPVSTERPFTIADKANLMEHVFEALWEYRFIYRDSDQLLSDNPELKPLFAEMFRLFMATSESVHKALAEAGLQNTNALQRRDLSYNTWLTLSNWFSFLRCCLPQQQAENLTRNQVKRGVYQLLSIERAFMTEKALPEMDRLLAHYYCELEIDPNIDPNIEANIDAN